MPKLLWRDIIMSFDKHAIETVANKPSSHFQLTTTELYNKILKRNEAELTELGAINAKTGEYTDVLQKINSLLTIHKLKTTSIGVLSTNRFQKKILESL